MALAATSGAFAAAVALLRQVSTSGTLVYQLGGWAAPWGIEYRIDLLGAYVLLIVTAIAALVGIVAVAAAPPSRSSISWRWRS